MIANLWLALSQQALDEFRYMRQDCSPDDSDPPVCVSPYSGPMDEETFRILSRMADTDNVQRMYRTVDAGGKTYTLFSLYFEGGTAAKEAVDYITTQWPTHLIAVGSWMWDSRQAGTQWELDQDGERTGEVTGTPLYPIHAQAYKFMPDVDGVPASSNADLRDINLLQGQDPRMFS